MVKQTAVLLLAACLTLTACSQSEPVPESTETSSQPGQQEDSGTSNEASGQSPEDTMKDQTETPTEAPSTGDRQDSQASSEESEASNDSQDPATEVEDHQGEAEPRKNTDQGEQPEAAVMRYHMNKVYNIVPSEESAPEKVVLLTFDDGPKEEEMLLQLLDTLDKHDAKAIFFVNGYRVEENPELLKLIHDRGQTIGNHSWDHIDLKKENSASVKQQIEDVQQIVEQEIGVKPRFFRPPFGSGGDTVKQTAKENDLLFMTWSNGSLDWDASTRNKPEAVIRNVMEQLHPGSNILMHELPWTVDALDELLTQLKSKGYGFVNPEEIEPEMK
ncbi:polysaccharide deacetylase family protein [Paenibacillus sp. F411]|uniref:polysaccharide deacetylase family protein n=1 Tax=Paenibacillus sp. F411 TaxID=2820239 RepID=UPI001AAEB6ED|nr:polysaccharide deacetylase family protein [Paenibacillus sp. F411]MBO2945050.1 polysaccharide deacetylase family protein [Paenibacillus sp. F411]